MNKQHPATIESEHHFLEIKRADKVRETVLATISTGHREEITKPLCSSDVITMEFLGKKVKGRVFFSRSELEVIMDEPIHLSTGRQHIVSPMVLHYRPHLALTLGAENAATPVCIQKAWSFLEGLLCDYLLLYPVQNDIREDYTRFLEEEKLIRSQEEIRNKPVLKRIDSLISEKTLLKQSFKKGQISEKEYKCRRSELISQIDANRAELSNEDVFGRIFHEELLLLRCENPRDFIRRIAT